MTLPRTISTPPTSVRHAQIDHNDGYKLAEHAKIDTMCLCTAAIEVRTIATVCAADGLLRRCSRTARAQCIPGPPWKAEQHHRRSKSDRSCTCTQDSSGSVTRIRLDVSDMRERTAGPSGACLHH